MILKLKTFDALSFVDRVLVSEICPQLGHRMDNQRLHCKTYLSDEGYGHIVRQRAVIEELRKLNTNLEFSVQTHRHLDAVKKLIPNIKPVDKYNNITWHKQVNGSPDLTKIKEQFGTYIEDSQAYVDEELKLEVPDFVISDFVYEAFEVAHQHNIPSFGVAHFTWDWFFCKLYPPPIDSKVIYRFLEMAGKARKLFFPPFTPEEILSHYKSKAVEVPLILRSHIDHKLSESNGRFKVMIIDSGAGVLKRAVSAALESVHELKDFQFFVNSAFETNQENVSFIPKDDLMVDYINDMDLVIGRAGFNTISECIGLRTPMLLLGEAMNPEMNENILNLKKAHLGTFIGLKTFMHDLGKFLPTFLQHEYKFIAQELKNHEFETNGASVIAKTIYEDIK